MVGLKSFYVPVSLTLTVRVLSWVLNTCQTKQNSLEVYNNKGVNIKYLDLTWVGEEEPVEMWTQKRNDRSRLRIENGAVLVPEDPLEVEFRGQKITIDKPTPFPEGELKLSGPVLVETLIN